MMFGFEGGAFSTATAGSAAPATHKAKVRITGFFIELGFRVLLVQTVDLTARLPKMVSVLVAELHTGCYDLIPLTENKGKPIANQIVWFDTPVKDLDRAIRFYSAVLGAKIKKEEMPGMTFAVLPHE